MPATTTEIPMHLPLAELLSKADRGEAPWFLLRRRVNDRRAVYTLRSDVLYYYTENWNRNRNADHDRVLKIMHSIEKEIDHRLYVAWIDDHPSQHRFMIYDGNHRREALNRLYELKGQTYWIDVDIVMRVKDTDVIEAFKRINQSICLPDSYINYDAFNEENGVARCEKWIQEIAERWPRAVVAKNRTRVPYCTKNDLADFLMDYFRLEGSEEELMVRLEMMNTENRMVVGRKSACVQSAAIDMDCFLFTEGIAKLRRSLLPSRCIAYNIV
jgi:hypothetical protein